MAPDTRNTRSGESPWKLSPEEMARFEEAARRSRDYRGTEQQPEAIFNQNDFPEHVLLIKEGRVRITRFPETHGPQVLLDTRGKGELVGEIAAIDRRPRTARVWTTGLVRGAEMSADDFERFLKANPYIMWRLLVAQVRAVRDADARLAAGRMPAAKRVIWWLKDQCAKELEARPSRRASEVVRVPLSRRDLAELAMVSDGVVSRALKPLREAGIIGPCRGGYPIRDPEALLKWSWRR